MKEIQPWDSEIMVLSRAIQIHEIVVKKICDGYVQNTIRLFLIIITKFFVRFSSLILSFWEFRVGSIASLARSWRFLSYAVLKTSLTAA